MNINNPNSEIATLNYFFCTGKYNKAIRSKKYGIWYDYLHVAHVSTLLYKIIDLGEKNLGEIFSSQYEKIIE